MSQSQVLASREMQCLLVVNNNATQLPSIGCLYKLASLCLADSCAGSGRCLDRNRDGWASGSCSCGFDDGVLGLRLGGRGL